MGFTQGGGYLRDEVRRLQGRITELNAKLAQAEEDALAARAFREALAEMLDCPATHANILEAVEMLKGNL